MNKNQVKRIVPWTDRYEFENVYEEFYSNDNSKQLHAVGRSFIWKSRVLHKLPVAIESTASLVNAVIDYTQAEKSNLLQENYYKLQNVFSLALIRFVNHITEKGQTKQYAQPVHMLAAELGVPEWIVELRHNATHGTLPSLSMLRSAAHWALQWLKVEFWEKQLENMQGLTQSDTQVDRESSYETQEIRKTIKDYQEEKFREYQGLQDKERANSGRLVDSIERYLNSDRTTAISCLLEEGCLISTRQQLASLSIKLLDSEYQLPDRIISLWKPVLRLVHHLKLTPLLLRKMVAMLTMEISWTNKMLCKWIYSIVMSNHSTGKSHPKNAGVQLYKSSVNLPTKALLESCLKVPSLCSAPIIKLLMTVQVPPLPEQKIQQLKYLVDLQTDQKVRKHNSKHVVCGDKEYFTKQDITQQTSSHEETRIPIGKSDIANTTTTTSLPIGETDISDTRWTLCTDAVDWSQVPIGYLTDQKIGYCDLELKTELEESEDVEEKMEIDSSGGSEDGCSDSENSLSNGTDIWKVQDLVKLKQNIQLF